VEQDAKPLCDENGLSVLAYSSLAQGLLTGKFGPDHQFPEGDVRATNKLFQGELYQQAQTALTQLRPIADRYSHHPGQSGPGLAAGPAPNLRHCRCPQRRAGAGKCLKLLPSPSALRIWQRWIAISRTVTDRLDANPVMWNLN
jgi:myo-inositol catabolism protein IolS